ncbi:MAG: hypothetical protein GKR89_35325 [Candidatus Latescibacteria bacterium]|nr:hypothetical protein [Candidatus Latescibacterota bacterium]
MKRFTSRGRGFNLPQGPVTYKYIEVGKTLYHAPSIGTARFSSRLAHRMLNELFAAEKGITTVYDPFCGNGVLLHTAYLLFNEQLDKIIGSDLSPLAMDSSWRNMQWLNDAKALEERLYAIESFATEDVEVKEFAQQRCRLMFEHAKGIDMEVELFSQDATCIGQRLAFLQEEVALVTDPPYSHPGEDGRNNADFGPLPAFLEQAAAATNVRCLLLCYRLDAPVLPLLEAHFAVEVLRGTKGRAVYYCRRDR